MLNIKNIGAAYTLGANTAKTLKVGDTFKGAAGEAARFYVRDTAEYQLFINGFLNNLPQVYTDSNNIIVQLGE